MLEYLCFAIRKTSLQKCPTRARRSIVGRLKGATASFEILRKDLLSAQSLSPREVEACYSCFKLRLELQMTYPFGAFVLEQMDIGIGAQL